MMAGTHTVDGSNSTDGRLEPFASHFTDIGGGWFFALDEDWMMTDGGCPLGFIGDASSVSPDVEYGPAAWGGGPGPLSSRTLATISGFPVGHDYASHPFPGTLRVTTAGNEVGLGVIDGQTFQTLEELLNQECFKRGDAAPLASTRGDRLASVYRRLPAVFPQDSL